VRLTPRAMIPSIGVAPQPGAGRARPSVLPTSVLFFVATNVTALMSPRIVMSLVPTGHRIALAAPALLYAPKR
jgi:hypothetical protein